MLYVIGSQHNSLARHGQGKFASASPFVSLKSASAFFYFVILVLTNRIIGIFIIYTFCCCYC